MAASITSRSNYVGETKKLLRNGYGIYTYENQFFKYQGEWQNGKKHGHGKLMMKDGTFYEGQFLNGEIQGHGYKFFAMTGSKYTGNFVRGELHGYGIMQYPDGTMFEGEWARNKKQGYGVLKTSEVGTYHGEFVGSVKHGQGTMLYDNGDRYDGHWVLDKRQGHGHLQCRNGTVYEGQWLNDRFHGEGKMNHSSGIIYEGQWINGYPARMATKLTIILERDPLELQQGDMFSVRVECRDDNDELIEDEGRELQVTAGFRHYPTKEGSALFDMIEDVEEKPIETPFGYAIVSYPLSDQLAAEESKEGSQEEETKKEGDGETEVKTTQEEEISKGEEVPQGTEEEKGEDGEKVEEKKGDAEEAQRDGETEGDGEEGVSAQQQEQEQDQVPETSTAAPVEATPLPPPVANQRTVGGVCDWGSLQLAPPPPMYRPFLAMEEEAALKKSKSKKPTAAKDKAADRTDSKHAKKDAKEKASTENLVDEQFARPGEYLLMAQDITNPPFFSGPLPPAFMLIKVLKPKPKKKESKPK